MVKELKIASKTENIAAAVEFVEAALRESGIERRSVNRSAVAAEELLVLMVQHAPDEESIIRIRVKLRKKRAVIRFSGRGSAFSLEDTESAMLGLDMAELDDEQEAAIRGMLLNGLADSLRVQHTRGINRAEIRADGVPNRRRNNMLCYAAAGLVLGLVLRLLPEAVSGFVSVNILSVLTALFMNAIRMVIAPLVFFSIAESVAGFSDMKAFGRIGSKIMGLYLFTTMTALCVGFGMSMLVHPGDPSLQEAVLAMSGVLEIEPAAALTIPEIITGIVPSNLLAAFLNADMLQIIFLGIVMGAASGMLGEHSEGVQNFLHAGSALFGRIAGMVIQCVSAALVCIIANTVLSVDSSAVLALLRLLAASVGGMCLMIGCYTLLLVVVGRKNPITFFKKFRPAMLMGASTMSSNATMPVTMECMRKLGVSQKVYSFSIPLGATINMDGGSVDYMCMLLFMMRVFNVPLTMGNVTLIFINVALMSVATPGIPNATVAMLAMLFTQFGIPVGAAGFLLGYDIIADVARTVSNITGDAVVSTIVASSEGLLDDEVYHQQ